MSVKIYYMSGTNKQTDIMPLPSHDRQCFKNIAFRRNQNRSILKVETCWRSQLSRFTTPYILNSVKMLITYFECVKKGNPAYIVCKLFLLCFCLFGFVSIHVLSLLLSCLWLICIYCMFFDKRKKCNNSDINADINPLLGHP